MFESIFPADRYIYRNSCRINPIFLVAEGNNVQILSKSRVGPLCKESFCLSHQQWTDKIFTFTSVIVFILLYKVTDTADMSH